MITAAAAVETPEQHHLPPSRLHQQQLLQNNKFLSAAVAPPAVAVNNSLKNNQQLHRKYCNPHRHQSQTLLDQRWQQRHRQMPRYFYLICFHEQKFYEAFNKRPFQFRRLVVLSNLSLPNSGRRAGRGCAASTTKPRWWWRGRVSCCFSCLPLSNKGARFIRNSTTSLSCIGVGINR